MRNLGGYTLLERIASGPSSEIYIGADARTTRGAAPEFCAIKLVRPRLARDVAFVDALLKDAPAATHFRHRSSVETRDVITADGEVLIVEELLKARSLGEVLERGEVEKKPLARELMLWIGMEVASVLEALHRTPWSKHGGEMMWHGALSPFDILIEETGHVGVLGCGLGRARCATAPALDRLPYVAPELAAGEAASALSDIYALAVIIYDAIAGGRVFRRATAAETRTAILRGDFPRMAERTDYANAIVDELLAQSMSRWPESRPQSAAYVERALKSQVRGTEESASARIAEHLRRLFGTELEAFERTMDSARRRVRVEHEGETADMFRPLGAPSNDAAFGANTEPMKKLEEPPAPEPEVTEVPDVGSVTEPQRAVSAPRAKPQSSKQNAKLDAQEDLLQPTDLLADLFESIEDSAIMTAPPTTEPVALTPPKPQAPARGPSRPAFALTSAPVDLPVTVPPQSRTPSVPVPQYSPQHSAPHSPPPAQAQKPPPAQQTQKPPPIVPRKVSTPPRATSTPGRATTSGAAEVAGAPARFLEKLQALLSGYELGPEIVKAGPISGLEAHVLETRAPVLVLALDLERMDDARLPREEWVASFDRVGAIARKVTPPLLRLIDSGAQGSVRFLVLDHSEGALLSLVIGRGKVLGTEPVRKIIASVATALHHLHERGVLFCNVQAHAVWLTREGSARLIDFSMAAPIGGPLNPLLPTNVFALSPEYLWGREYGPASDQFALGALLYELLTQTRPFRGLDTDIIIAAIRDKDPIPPHTIDSRVDRLLSDVAMRALEKDPRRRFNSMAELARLVSSGS